MMQYKEREEGKQSEKGDAGDEEEQHNDRPR